MAAVACRAESGLAFGKTEQPLDLAVRDSTWTGSVLPPRGTRGAHVRALVVSKTRASDTARRDETQYEAARSEGDNFGALIVGRG